MFASAILGSGGVLDEPSPCITSAGSARRMRDPRASDVPRPLGPEPGARAAGRSRYRQDRVARLPAGAHVGVQHCASGRCGARDGARVRHVAATLRAAAGIPRSAARSATRRAGHRVRSPRRRRARSLPGRAGGAHSDRRSHREPAADLCRGRRAVDRPRLGADTGVRRAPTDRRAGRDDSRCETARAATPTS